MVSNEIGAHADPAEYPGATAPLSPPGAPHLQVLDNQTPAAECDDELMTSDVDTPPPSFEEALTELETLVDTLEEGELTLAQSLAAFERGIKLTRNCQKALDEAEQKVRILTAKSPGAQTEPFAAGDPENGT
jgi:exodeoxyribonuclease VII small subunit